MQQVQRNDPCPCGSGKKYKKCCMGKTEVNPGKAKNRYVPIALIAIFLLSIVLRVYGFQQPHGLTFDEGLYADLISQQLKENPLNYSTQEAYQVHTARGERLPEYLDRPLFKHPPLYNYFIALNYKMFGLGHFSAVSVSILFGSLMVLIIFLLGKELYDARVGLLAAFFLCIDPVHWVCSERIWMETTMGFFVLLAIYLFVVGLKQKKYMVLSGISVGLAMLSKYPGALALFIIISFAAFFNRELLKQKNFWILCLTSLLVFSPWIVWNWKVYGNLNDPLVSAHALQIHWGNAMAIFREYKGFLLGLPVVITGLYILRNKIRLAFGGGSTEHLTLKRKRLIWILSLFAGTLVLVTIPLLREMAKEAFIWKDTILVGWSNPFSKGPWHFYITRLSELSPLYIFSFLSLFFIFGRNKGDQLLLLSSLLIIGAFILLGNYQSRYILPVVPFLLILSARFQVWVYDKLNINGEGALTTTNFDAFKLLLKIALLGIVLYFTLKTLRADWLIAIGPDFGYF